MTDQIIAIMPGSQTFPDSAATVRVELVNRESTEEKGQMVSVAASRKLTEEANWGSDFNKFNVGPREMVAVGRTADICPALDGDHAHGHYKYQIGGVGNNEVLGISVRHVGYDGNTLQQDTLLLLSQHAPMVQVTSNFPHEPLAVSNQNQIFKGRAWPLTHRHIGEYNLRPKPQYLLRFKALEDCDEDDLFFLEFDDEVFSWDDMIPQVEVHQSDRTRRTRIVQQEPRQKRRIKRRSRRG